MQITLWWEPGICRIFLKFSRWFFFFFFFLISFYFQTLHNCTRSAKHQNESTTGIHVLCTLKTTAFLIIKMNWRQCHIYVSSLIYYVLVHILHWITGSQCVSQESREIHRPGGLWGENNFHSDTKALFIIITIILSLI